MPRYKTIICHYCNKKFDISIKRYNESRKNNWRFYCSPWCLSNSKKTGRYIKCANPSCHNEIYISIGRSGSMTYCSQSCAAKTNNSSRKTIKYCGNPDCNNTITKRNKYCSIKCQQQSQRRPDNYYLNKIKAFFLSNGRLPVKREMNNIHSTIIKRFGSWNKAVLLSGFSPNPVLFSKKHIANDGHICDSLSEKILDDWLFCRKIPHNRNVQYPSNPKLKADFVCGEYWIEFFGLKGQLKSYDILAKHKLHIAKQHKLNLIPIYPEDIFPDFDFQEKLKFLLRK